MARDATLSAAIIDFCGQLRRDLHFTVGHAEARDALRAAQIVGVADWQRVRDALRLVLCSKPEERELFNAAFDAFFFHPDRGVRQAGYAPRHTRKSQSSQRATFDASPKPAKPGLSEHGSDTAASVVAALSRQPMLASESNDAASGWETMRAQFSPVAGALSAPTVASARVRELLPFANKLVSSVRLGKLRKWKPLDAGPRFDMRRTLRSSLHTGGDPVALRMLGHPRLNARFVLLLDGSRSMVPHGQLMLEFAYALCRRSQRANVFVFSTELKEITLSLRRSARHHEHQLSELGEAWGGGTKIGASLLHFVHRYGGRRLTNETVTIIYSDGLDVGDVAALQRAMNEIHWHSAAVIWINPLIGSVGYEPSAAGMHAAMPYVDAFIGVREARDLAGLAHHAAVVTR